MKHFVFAAGTLAAIALGPAMAGGVPQLHSTSGGAQPTGAKLVTCAPGFKMSNAHGVPGSADSGFQCQAVAMACPAAGLRVPEIPEVPKAEPLSDGTFRFTYVCAYGSLH